MILQKQARVKEGKIEHQRKASQDQRRYSRRKVEVRRSVNMGRMDVYERMSIMDMIMAKAIRMFMIGIGADPNPDNPVEHPYLERVYRLVNKRKELLWKKQSHSYRMPTSLHHDLAHGHHSMTLK